MGTVACFCRNELFKIVFKMKLIRFRKKHITISGLFVLFLFIVIVFFSNRALLFLFKDKIWAHKVNSIEKLEEVGKLFPGAELDVVFYANGNYFDVNHPPDKSVNLSLAEYFQSKKNDPNFKYWIDFKNLNQDNELLSANRLDSITRIFNIKKRNIIIESVNPQFLKTYLNKGFFTSYYLPTNLHSLDNDSLMVVLEQIKKNLISHKNTYISTGYKNYPIINKQFPKKKKLVWFTVYGPVNKIRARIMLYEILLDKNVDVLLIPFHPKKRRLFKTL